MSGYGIGINAFPSDLEALNIALNYPNINSPAFRAQNYNPTASTQSYTTQLPQDESKSKEVLPKADYSSNNSTPAILVGGALSAAALVGCLIKGKGNPLTGAKKICSEVGNSIKKFVGSSKKTSSLKAQEQLSHIKVKVDETGKVHYYIPGKTTTTEDAAAIQAFLNRDTKLSGQLIGLRFRTGETKINNATFDIVENEIKHQIRFEGNQIKSINAWDKDSSTWKDITADYINGSGRFKDGLNADNENFATTIKETIEKIKTGDKEILIDKNYNLSDMQYTTRIGDNVAEVTRASLGKATGNPTITKLTTLQEFSKDDTALKAYIEKQRIEGNDLSGLIGKDFLSSNKVPEGFKVYSFEFKEGGKTFKVVDGQCVAVDGHKSGTDEFYAYMATNRQKVEKAIEKQLKNNRCPKNSVIIPA